MQGIGDITAHKAAIVKKCSLGVNISFVWTKDTRNVARALRNYRQSKPVRASVLLLL